MTSFESRYKQLNDIQKKAVDNTEGPVLVIAGPGTGKTEIISLRVANIIKQTDTLPSNILCLTFTDNAARNMRERLESTIGQAAFHVNIHTFHSFGAEIINQYPDFFLDRELIQQVDELGSYQLLKELFDKLPHASPLSVKIGDEYVMLKDTLSIISWLKQNALTAADLNQIIDSNQLFMADLSELIKTTFRLPTSPKNLDSYQKLLKAMGLQAKHKMIHDFPQYAAICQDELAEAINLTDSKSRFAPHITAWRNRWCVKDAKGLHVFKDGGKNTSKLQAVANVYEAMVKTMKERGLYDFDDMIVETVQAIEKSSELKLNLQEKYLYILVDEFQDTNKAQLRILEALGDNPIFEGRPNIMAVGDDDQAIYSFQGAEVSNMVAFTRKYRDTALITLTDNYRSTNTIIDTSYSVANQITDRLESIFPDTHKQLEAQTTSKLNRVAHNVLPSELAQYQWLAEQISSYVKEGIRPEEIAVIAPRHRYLERLVPYLATLKLPVSYERRENILEAPITHQLLIMSRLVLAIADNDQRKIDGLFGEVLSYAFWDIPIETILNISVNCYDKHLHWLPSLLAHQDPKLHQIAKWFIGLAGRSTTEPLEYVLDNLLGVLDDGADSEQDEIERLTVKKRFVSPMRDYYFNQHSYDSKTDVYLSLLGQLSTLRQRLRQWRPSTILYIKDLIDFTDLHAEAKLKIIDTNPHTQTTNAVQVMTAYKAKGLEFEVVFVINAQDEIWGPTRRSRSARISLPKNLPLAPTGDSDNDKLRLLFVAMSRAKHTLVITSYSHTYDDDTEMEIEPGWDEKAPPPVDPLHPDSTSR